MQTILSVMRRRNDGTTPKWVLPIGALLLVLSALFIFQSATQHTANAAGKGVTSSAPQSSNQNEPNNGKQGYSNPADQPRPSSLGITSTDWTNINPNLYAVGAASSTEAWAVGENGHMLHYTGGSWVVDDQPAMASSYLRQVAMLSPTSGWIPAYYKAFFYDGTSWVEKSAGLGGPYPSLSIYTVSPVADNDVWAIGYKGGSTFVHWDGTTWTALPPYSSTVHLSDIAMESATSGWATGSNTVGGVNSPILFHYDGTNWTQLAGPLDAVGLGSMSLAAPGDVWAGGWDSSNVQMIYRYNNGVWSSWQNPGGANTSDIYMESPTRGWLLAGIFNIVAWDGSTWSVEYNSNRVRSISGSGGQIWAAGDGNTIIARTDSTPWSVQHAGITQASLQSVSTLSTTEAWAVGSNGGCTPAVLQYIGGTWQSVPTGSLSGCLWNVQMLSSTEGYVVGSDGIGRWDGSSWQTEPNTSGQNLSGIYMTSSGEGWAVGYSGVIWHDSGGTWSLASSPTPYDLVSVAMDSPSHGWVVGSGWDNVNNEAITTILEYDGTTWVDRSDTVAGTKMQLQDIALNSAGEGWAVGLPDVVQPNTPAALHLSNGVWSVIQDATSDSGLLAVSTEANGEAWMVGYGDFYHYVGGVSQAVTLPGDNLRGISLVPGRGGWAVSNYGGQILQYNPLSDGRRFYDVPVGSTFYSYIECMASSGIINGYQADNTFRPNNPVTRGQLSKIIALSANYQDPPGAQRFEDVVPGSTFFVYAQQLAIHGILSGYACGDVGEPCGPGNLPYFRPNNNATRGQITKVVSESAGFQDPVSGQTFEDVAIGSTYYIFIERLVLHNVMGGYACGGAGEPCGPGNRPYFRPGNNSTRGQVAKIVTNAFFPTCAP